MGKIVKSMLLFVVALCMAGCTPASIKKAAQASENASNIVKNLETAEIAAVKSGLVPVSDDVVIQQGISAVSSVGLTVDSCITNSGNTAGAVACINTAVTQIQALQQAGALHLKSQAAQSEFSIAISGVEGVLLAVDTQLGATPPAATTTTTTN